LNSNYQSLAYFMRRPTGFHAADLVPFYSDVIGLPVMRDYEDRAIIMWAGEDLIFEIKCDDHPSATDADPSASSCLPVFRSHDLNQTRARLATHGYHAVAERQTELGRTFFILGPDRLLLGFEERSADSPLGADREALSRWRGGQTRLAEVPPLPADLHYLNRVVRHASDVQMVSRFYEECFGLDQVGVEDDSILLSLGDTVLLEIAPGGRAGEVPEDRDGVPNSLIVRIHEFDTFVAGLIERGARFSGQEIAYPTGTRLLYVADPDGNLTGIEERTLWGNYDEDVEAERRWRDRQPSDVPPRITS
jgi:catechol-2,3-dioxygenase